jgi:hypothetical protein
MAVFVKNIAYHFRPGIEKHIVAEGRRPIRYGQSRTFAGHQTADEEQWKCRADEQESESVRPD